MVYGFVPFTGWFTIIQEQLKKGVSMIDSQILMNELLTNDSLIQDLPVCSLVTRHYLYSPPLGIIREVLNKKTTIY